MTRRAWLARALGLLALQARNVVTGRLYRLGQRGPYPAQGVAVRLNHPKLGPSATVYSDANGIYTLVGIPPGDYTLKVWTTAQTALVFRVAVLAQPRTEIPAIRVP